MLAALWQNASVRFVSCVVVFGLRIISFRQQEATTESVTLLHYMTSRLWPFVCPWFFAYDTVYFLLEHGPLLYSDCSITSRLWFSQATWYICSQLDSLRAHTLPPIRFEIHVCTPECAGCFSFVVTCSDCFVFLRYAWIYLLWDDNTKMNFDRRYVTRIGMVGISCKEVTEKLWSRWGMTCIAERPI